MKHIDLNKVAQQITDAFQKALETVAKEPVTMGSPRFLVKHALRASGIFMDSDNYLWTDRGINVGRASEFRVEGTVVYYKLEPANHLKWVEVSINTEDL